MNPWYKQAVFLQATKPSSLDGSTMTAQAYPKSFVCLVGMPGAGKTTAGALLAKRLQVPFWDLDEEVVRDCGLSIATLFAQRGEAAFRHHEAVTLHRLLTQHDAGVIACGGGTWSQPALRTLMAQKSSPVWLDATFAVLAQRLLAYSGTPVRPLLAQADPTAALQTLWQARQDDFRLCPYRVDTSGLTPHKVAEAITELVCLPI
jgi:shikimate kinase